MKKFKFRLERVLRYREAVKEEKKRELMILNLKLQEEESRLEALNEAAQNNALAAQGILSSQEVVLNGAYAIRLHNEIEAQKLAIIEVEHAVEEATQEYIEAAKEAESLVTLKKRRKGEYMEYVRHEEEKFLDELMIQGSSKRLRNRG